MLFNSLSFAIFLPLVFGVYCSFAKKIAESRAIPKS